MKSLLRTFVLMTCLSLNTNLLMAQWVQTNGPEGGYFRELAFVNNELLAFGDDVYASSDRGLSWTRRSSAPIMPQRAFVDGSLLFLMGQYGVFMSEDRGVTWSDRSVGLPAETNALSMSRVDDLLFLGSQVFSSGYPYDPYGALYRSRDNGTSWEQVSFPFVPDDIAVISLLAVDTILIAGGQKAIYRSTDRGSSWSVVVDTTGAEDLALKNGYVFAGTRNGPLRSSDSGATWISSRGDLVSGFSAGRFSQSGSMLYGVDYHDGPFRSSDAGDHWEDVTDGLRWPFHVRPLVSRDSLVVVSSYSYGFFRSTTYGATWKDANSGIVSTSIKALYADDNTLLAATVFPSSTLGNLFRSTDQGVTWPSTDTIGRDSKRCFLRVNDSLFAGTYQGVEISTDDGFTWTAAGTGILAWGTRVLAMMNDTLFAVSNGGVYRSIDHGASWSAVNSGLPPFAYARELMVIPATGGEGKVILVGTSLGVHRSADGGDNWTSANIGLTNDQVRAFASSPASTGSGLNLYVGTDGGVFRSPDDGQNWIPASVGLTDISVTALLACPFSSGSDTVLLAVTGDGIFRTSTQGESWVSINTGLEGVPVTALAVNSTDVIAGTVRGVWRRPLTEIVGSWAVENGAIPLDLSLRQNYPNPFNPSTTIQYELPEQAYVTLRVFNLLGQEVAELVDEVKTAGYKTVDFNGSGLPSGMYLYRLTAGKFVATKKLLLLR